MIWILFFIVSLMMINAVFFPPNVQYNSELDSDDSASSMPSNSIPSSISSSRSDGDNNGNISLAFFYDPDCPCSYYAMMVLNFIQNKYPGVSQFWYNLSSTENKTRLIDFLEAYNVPYNIRASTPFIFIGDYYVSYYDIQNDSISNIIDLYSGMDVPLWPAWKLTWTMHIAFFYDPTEDPAKIVLGHVISLNSSWNQNVTHLIVHNYSLEDPTNKLLFDAYFSEFNLSLISPYNDPVEIYAGVFIGNDFLLNDDITYDSINNTITNHSGHNTALQDISPNLAGGKICIILFHSPTCGECNKAREILNKMKGKYPDLDVREYNIADPENRVLQESYFEYYDVPRSKQGTLGVFIGDRYFVNPDKMEDDIEDVIRENIDGCPCPEVEADKDIVKENFLSFTVLAVLLAGIVDSINPCAIATLIFFIAYLAATGRTKKQVLFIGIAYAFGIFITYMALGLGIYSIIATSRREVDLFSEILYPIMITITFLFGFYSIYDYHKVRKGKKEDMKLQLPKGIKSMISRIIKHQVPLRYFVLFAIITGVLISTLEFLCTGQIYLPTIIVVASTVPEFQGQAVVLLFLYNLMFILPLVIIFTLVYFGMSSEHLQGFLDRNRAMFKLLTAIVFFVLGFFLMWYSLEFVF